MTDTVREQVVAAFASRMDAQRAQQTFDDLPARSLWDSSDGEIERTPYGQVAVTMTVTVETLHKAERDPAGWSAQGNAVLGDLIAQATGSDRTLGGLCDNIAYAGGTIYYPDDGSDVLGVDINCEIRFRFDLGNPFANSQ